jgi:TetR/AcrR family transcriptional repressor of nem operon
MIEWCGDKAGMGRPREFDEGEVLQRAAEVFRAKGYKATSTRDLEQYTGLTSASLYNAFSDKRALYLRALAQYLDRSLRERIARLEALPSPADAIVCFFEEIIERSLADPRHRGCLLVNTALEASSDDRDLQQFVADHTQMIEAFFRRRIVAGQRMGQIPADRSAGDVARMLLSIVMGLRVLVRVRPEAALLTDLVRPALSVLGLSWPRRKAGGGQKKKVATKRSTIRA